MLILCSSSSHLAWSVSRQAHPFSRFTKHSLVTVGVPAILYMRKGRALLFVVAATSAFGLACLILGTADENMCGYFEWPMGGVVAMLLPLVCCGFFYANLMIAHSGAKQLVQKKIFLGVDFCAGCSSVALCFMLLCAIFFG